MGQTLEALHRLQIVEKQLAEMRSDRQAKVRRLELQKRQAEKAEERLQQSRSDARQCQIRLDALQLDIAAREDAVANHRLALNKAKTNKEYAAILSAMNTEKADNTKLEAEVFQLMQEAQDRSDEAKRIEAERAKIEEDVARAQAALDDYDNKTRARLDPLNAQRADCAQHIEPTTLATFTRVAEHHDGEAMVPIVKSHPRRSEYMCGGCNITVTLQMLNSLQTRDEVQTCTACGRILYLEEAVKERSRA